MLTQGGGDDVGLESFIIFIQFCAWDRAQLLSPALTQAFNVSCKAKITPVIIEMKKFDITQGIAYYIGSDIQTKKHSHHALEFIFGLDLPFDFYTSDVEFKYVYGVLVAPDISHQFIGNKSDGKSNPNMNSRA